MPEMRNVRRERKRTEKNELRGKEIQEYRRHIQALLVKKLKRHDKTAPGMQDLAQEVSTKGAKGERRNRSPRRRSRRLNRVEASWRRISVGKGPSQQSYPKDAGFQSFNRRLRPPSWGWARPREVSKTLSRRGVTRSPAVPRDPTSETIGRAQGPLAWTREGLRKHHRVSESNVEACEWVSGGKGNGLGKNARTA
ncbi:hypothetical protein DFH06DRAFT_1131913 [Mycena polygramma]|nr:hypothetical protein DFH06DRAFT_1131913 [Mycena polygramma]